MTYSHLTRRRFLAASTATGLAAPSLVHGQMPTVPLVRIRLAREPFPFDPAQSFLWDNAFVYRSIYAPMTRWTRNGSSPYLVENIQEDHDTSGKFAIWRIRVDLPPHATWSGPNARRLQPKDIANTVERLRDEGWKPWDEVEKTEIIDSHSLHLYLHRPNQALWRDAFPRAIGCIAFEGAQIDPDATRAGEASGPYAIETHEPDVEFDLLRRNDWHRNLPIIERARFKVITDSVAAWAEFQAGGIDILDVTERMIGSQAQPLFDAAQGSFITQPSDQVVFVGVDQRTAQTSNRAVRQAMTTALNRTAIARAGYGDSALPAFGVIPRQYPGGLTEPDRVFAQGNPDQAREILNRTQFAGGFDIPLSIPEWLGKPGKDMAEAMRAQLQSIGINAVPRVMRSEVLRNTPPGQLGLFLQTTRAGYDPSRTMQDFVSTDPFNKTGFVNEEFNALFLQALNEQDRAELYTQMQAILIEDATVVPIAQLNRTWAISTEMQNQNLAPSFTPDGRLGDLASFNIQR